MRFYSSWRGFDMDDLELKVFQVQVKWHVFRIPVGKYPDVYDMLNDWLLKNMSRIAEALYNGVLFSEKYKVPYYKLTVDPADKPEIITVQGAHFYVGF